MRNMEEQQTWRGFSRYPAYKDSGVEWLGQIPAHWEVKRLKFVVAFYGGGTPSKDNLNYWNGDIPWVSPKDMKAESIADTEDHITEEAVADSSTRVIQPGAVLIVVRSGILRHSLPVAINTRPVALNQDMKALVPGRFLEASYLKYFIAGHQSALLVQWRKEGATVESIEHELLVYTSCPIPSPLEQKAITDFLDRETAKIDALVAKKERLIELLQEQRIALISHAVTKGRDPRVRMKDSGIEWLGMIPAHWVSSIRMAVLALDNRGAFVNGPFGSDLLTSELVETGVPVIYIRDIKPEGYQRSSTARRPSTAWTLSSSSTACPSSPPSSKIPLWDRLSKTLSTNTASTATRVNPSSPSAAAWRTSRSIRISFI
jgi:hypothetical protein